MVDRLQGLSAWGTRLFAGVAALVFSLVIAPSAHAVCVGDCNNNNVVAVNELVTGVNILLETQALSTCPNFDVNNDGMVLVNELVSAVNNLLDDCPPVVEPTDTPVQPTNTVPPVATDTPVEPTSTVPPVATDTPAEPTNTVPPVATDTPGEATNTPEATDTPGEATNTPEVPTSTVPPSSPTPTNTPMEIIIGTHQCILDETPIGCIGGPNNGDPCTQNSDCGAQGTCARESRIELNLQLGAAALSLPFNSGGDINLDCGAVGPNGNAQCSCDIGEFNPINIPTIGFICILPGTGCPPGVVDCEGDAQLGVDMTADGNIGTCTNNTNCETLCESACGTMSKTRLASGCTGYCNGGERDNMTCDMDTADCPGGACNGPDPVPAPRAGICQCQCIDRATFGAAAAGDMQCNLGAAIRVEAQPPCDGSDVTIRVGTTCIPLSTQRVDTFINDANFASTPDIGPVSNLGEQITCEQFADGDISGLRLVGAATFFGSALGDLAVEVFTLCQ